MDTRRRQYSEQQKDIVRRKYPLCSNTADRLTLCREARIVRPDGSENLVGLYGLAHRLGVSDKHKVAGGDVSATIADEFGIDNGAASLQRLFVRDDPTGRWTADDDRYLNEHWGHDPIEQIALWLNRSESSIARRARQLRLRQVPRYYDLNKVWTWLGVATPTADGTPAAETIDDSLFVIPRPHDHDALVRRGLELYPCHDQLGQLRIRLVSTMSLARVLFGSDGSSNFHERLVARRGADRVFIADIAESIAELRNGDASWEPDCWVSHGHTSLDPHSDLDFRRPYDGVDADVAVLRRTPSRFAPVAVAA